jgi:hypothetical protein
MRITYEGAEMTHRPDPQLERTGLRVEPVEHRRKFPETMLQAVEPIDGRDRGAALLRVAIVIASTGRPAELGRWIEHLRRQTVKPAVMVFAVTTQDDLPAGDLGGVRALICDVSGLCHQRNMGLSAVADAADVIAFFDDDYVPSSRCVEGIAAIFAERPDVVAANGVLLADGVNSPGISYADAQTHRPPRSYACAGSRNYSHAKRAIWVQYGV